MGSREAVNLYTVQFFLIGRMGRKFPQYCTPETEARSQSLLLKRRLENRTPMLDGEAMTSREGGGLLWGRSSSQLHFGSPTAVSRKTKLNRN